MSTVKNAVIAVAGMGKRLGFGQPKCLVKVKGKSILEYQLELLANVENVFLVVGFGEMDVMSFASKIRKDIIFVRNSNFQHTKTLGSFYCAAKIIEDSAIFMDGDMIIEPHSFSKFCDVAMRSFSDELTIAVSKRISDDPVYCDVKEEGDGKLKINAFSFEKKSPYEWANIFFMPANLIENGNTHTFEYLEKFLPAKAAIIDRLEIDTVADLKIAENEINTFFEL